MSIFKRKPKNITADAEAARRRAETHLAEVQAGLDSIGAWIEEARPRIEATQRAVADMVENYRQVRKSHEAQRARFAIVMGGFKAFTAELERLRPAVESAQQTQMEKRAHK